ncbi:MAG: hypothetical protein ABFS56_26090, partial [Pseudomonadota bacterium]
MQTIPLILSLIFFIMPAHAFDLSQKLAECETHFKANRLTTGKGGTALPCYEAVLKKDPTNSEAWRGLVKIEARYNYWINKALSRGQHKKAQRYQPGLRKVTAVKAKFPALPSTKPEVFVQLGHSSDVNAVAFSPDGKLALSGSSDNTLKLWEVSSGREIRSLTGHSSGVLAVAFSPDGKLALSGGDNTL